MTITFELNTPFFAWGETIKGRYRVKMGSNESIDKNNESSIWLALEPLISQNGEVATPPYIGFPWWATFDIDEKAAVSIGKGQTSPYMEFEFTLPQADDVVYESDGKTYADWFNEVAEECGGVDLNGGDRLQPFFHLVVSAGDSAHSYSYDTDFKHSGGFLYSRLAPAYTGFAMNDEGEKNPLSVLDAYLLGGESVPVISSDVTIDALDATLTATHKIELMSQAEEGSTPIVITSAEAPIGTPLKPTMPKSMELDYAKYVTGADGMKWVYTIADSAGNTATGTYYKRVYNYSLPVLLPVGANPVVERYKKVTDDEGNVSYVPSVDAQDVWTSYHAAVTPFATAGQNAWTLAIVYGADGSGDTQTITKTGTDATDGDVVKDRTTFADAAFSASTRYAVTLTLTDVIGRKASLTAYLDKAGGYFSIERNGVAVGMRSTGTADNKLFEVASDYESRFYGGIRGMNIHSTEEVDTGGRWLDGKKIYAKTLVKTGAANSQNHDLPIGVDVDMAWIDAAASFNKGSNGAVYPVGEISGSTAHFFAQIWLADSFVRCSCGRSGQTSDYYVRVLYTKLREETGVTDALMLYDHGDECTSVSGGWAAYAYRSSGTKSSVKTPTLTKNAASIELSLANSTANAWRAGCMMTGNAIDVTGYDVLKINVTGYSNPNNADPSIGVTATKANEYTRLAYKSITGTGEIAVDVSGVTGSVYVFVDIRAVEASTAAVKFNALWLEKT